MDCPLPKPSPNLGSKLAMSVPGMLDTGNLEGREARSTRKRKCRPRFESRLWRALAANLLLPYS